MRDVLDRRVDGERHSESPAGEGRCQTFEILDRDRQGGVALASER
jgi:hypothetical protein